MNEIKLANKEIEVWFDADFEQNLQAIKTIPDRRFKTLKRGKFWVVPASPFHAQQVVSLFSSFKIDPKVKSLVKTASAAAPKVEKDVLKGLYPFQKKGVEFILAAGGRVILGDEMGLGKSPQSLVFAKAMGSKIRQVIIVSPASVIFKWKNECSKWLDEDWDAEVVLKTKGPMPRARVLIMSYAVATARYLAIGDLHPDLLIMDEAHALKGDKSQRTRAFKQYSMGVPYILPLSASPFLNRPEELWNLLHALDSLTWSKQWDFLTRYCGLKQTGFGWDTTGATNQEELAKRLKPIMLRRLKVDVLDQLPALQRVIVPVKIDRKEYKAALANRPGNALAWLNELRQIVGRAKVPAAIEMAQDILEGGAEKLVVYAHHQSVVEQLTLGLAKYGVTSITGPVDKQERARRNEMFQTQKGTRIMIISAAGGEGIDLYAASAILFVERQWSPAMEEQAEGRLHRIGQRGAVTSYYLAAAHTMDEHLAKLVEEKRTVFHEIIGGADIETRVRKEILEVMRDEK